MMERPRSDLHKSYLDLVKDELNDEYKLPWSEFYHAVGMVIYTYGTNSKIPKDEDQRRFLRCIHTALKNTKERLQKAETEVIVRKSKEATHKIIDGAHLFQGYEAPDPDDQYRGPNGAA
jgi:hypothetical protein